MTKAELVKLRKAIKLLMANDRFHDAMCLLTELAGIDYPVAKAIRNARTVSIDKLPAKDHSWECTCGCDNCQHRPGCPRYIKR